MEKKKMSVKRIGIGIMELSDSLSVNSDVIINWG